MLPLCLVFGLEMLYREPLLDVSRRSVPQVQENFAGTGTERLLTVIGTLGSYEAILCYLAVCFNVLDRPTSLYLFTSMASVYYIVHCMKSYYKEQRLYLQDNEVQSTECDTGYENPSGIVTVNMFFWFSLFLHTFYREEVDEDRPILRSVALAVSSIGGLTFMILLGLSRVFLGGNAYNNILFGMTLGLVLALIAFVWYYPYAMEFAERRIVPAESGKDPYYSVSVTDVLLLLILGLGVPMFFAVTILNSHNGEIDWEFKQQVIWQKIWLGNGCEIDTTNPAEILQYKHFLQSGAVVVVFGSFAGQFAEWFAFVNRGLLNTSPWTW